MPRPRTEAQPQLAIVVDTEEEFDWTKPFSREQRSVRSIPAQAAAHEIYDRLGVVPTYVVGHPVVSDETAVAFFSGLLASGRAEIGAHLHPWVTPPHDETVTTRNSYGCNLPPALERAKIERLTAAIERTLGVRPTAFKAGRHGMGPATVKTLAALGYKVDCSVVPYTSFAGDGGPSFYGYPDQPYWLDPAHDLLEIPVTNGFFGRLGSLGRHLQPLFDHRLAERLRIPGILARTGLLERSRLTPEGAPASEQCALLGALVARGRGIFTLVYHSPSLAPGNTPYVRSRGELDDFVTRIDAVLRYFRDELGGRFTTLSQIHAEKLAERRREGVSRTLPRVPIETGAVTT